MLRSRSKPILALVIALSLLLSLTPALAQDRDADSRYRREPPVERSPSTADPRV